MGKILVTGGTGFIGSHTCVALTNAGYSVVVMDNLVNSKVESIARIEMITGKHIRFYRTDMLDEEGMRQIFEDNKIDAVIHFAGLKAVGESVQKPLEYYHNNISGTLSLLRVMREYGCRTMIFSSSATVYGCNNPVPYQEDMPTSATNPYGYTKVMIEQMLRDICVADPQFSVVALRYFNPIGAHESGRIGERPNGVPNNLMPYVTQVAAGIREKLSVFGGDYPTPDGTCIRDYVHVMDLAEGHAAALAYAAEHGKQVQCLLELRARFDEQSNIDYSRMLEDAGCDILYGLTKYKVHTKLCLITRRCPGGICYYTQVGTGNYNEKTAEQYTDLMLLTSNPAIGRDAAKTFDRLARGETAGETEALWVAPEGYKPQLLAHIDAQTRLGKDGYIGIKVNSMNDADVMARLVRASEAGVEVELFVRGICCLRPGVPGRTEHIAVRSIIGRYLEHERIFVFGRGNAQEVFIGSGDLLERNTMRRIEAFTAVTDPNARAEVLEVLSAMRRDNRQAWIMQPDGSYLRPDPTGEPFVSQTYLHTYFAGRTVAKSAPPAPPQPKKKLPWWRRLWIWLRNN